MNALGYFNFITENLKKLINIFLGLELYYITKTLFFNHINHKMEELMVETTYRIRQSPFEHAWTFVKVKMMMMIFNGNLSTFRILKTVL